LLGRLLGLDDAPAAATDEPKPVEAPTGADPRPSRRTPSGRRTLAAVVFLLVLAAILAYLARPGAEHAATATPPTRASTARSTAAPADTGALRAMVPDSQHCSDIVDTMPILRCSLETAEVEYRLVGTHAVSDAYRAAVGAPEARDRHGPPSCASGRDDERAWARPVEPTRAAGRYRCVLVDGRAEMWWTDDARGLVAHARAFSGDLARLFAWWQTRTEH
jgi:hypothetical protein